MEKGTFRYAKNLVHLICFLSGISFVSAQNAVIRVKLDTAIVIIGDQQKLTIEAKGTKGDKIVFPSFKDTLVNHIEVLATSKIDTTFLPDKKSVILSRSYTITSFDSGYYVIPPLPVVVNNDTILTDALLLSVLTLAVDTNKVIKDIKQPYNTPWSISEILDKIIIGAVLLIILSIIFYYIIKKRKKKPLVVEEKVEEIIPAHIIALEELQKLRDEKLWQVGKYKLFHIRLSDTVRIYIEKRFGINAPEQTTYETLQNFRSVPLDEELKRKLRQLLTLSDMVKFAKENPLGNENEMSIQNAFDFINGTILILNTDKDKEGKL
jgi:hypothetical protein